MLLLFYFLTHVYCKKKATFKSITLHFSKTPSASSNEQFVKFEFVETILWQLGVIWT